jgi:nucleotide-binding universal stress UspA family protein
MAVIRDLMVVLDGSAAGEVRLKVAAALAQQHEAHLTAFFALDLLMTHDDIQPADQAERLEATFHEHLRDHGLKGDWHEASGNVGEAVVRQARQADLVILGQVDPEHPPSSENRHLLENVLTTAGRTILLIPYIGRCGTVGTKILVGWNDTREATRAVNDAIVLMAHAHSVTVLTLYPEGRTSERGAGTSAGIVHHLARHGIIAHRAQMAVSISPASALLSYGADLNADLLVVGGYGHSQLRGIMLGGVTRVLLRHMTMPMLMSH